FVPDLHRAGHGRFQRFAQTTAGEAAGVQRHRGRVEKGHRLVAATQMKSLQDRKHDLLTESEINRHVLRLELQQTHMRFEQICLSWQKHAWKFAAPLAGFLLARKFKKTPGFVAKGSLVVMALSKLWNFWQERRGQKPPR